MLIKTWKDIKNNVYSPYSNTKEVCVVIDSKGFAHIGVRVENAAFPDTITAYQAAVYGCLAAGEVPMDLIVENESQTDDWQAIYLSDEYQLRLFAQPTLGEIQVFNPFKQVYSLSIEDLKPILKFAQTENSDFPVAALLKTEYGFVSGSNMENTDWRLGLCAERVALVRAISNGAKQLGELHVFAPKAEYCSPCGACRQVMVEHIPEARIFLYHADETHSEIIMHYLLPHSFTSSNLKKD